MSNPKVT
ncbi:hypothetical protein Anas_08669 [Armadillidium nasatum]|nr:hypothetical protein Anas_08669 [Armadillidium nasatum]